MDAPDEVIEQIRWVREDGGANMMSAQEVQFVANKLHFYALVNFIEDLKRLPQRQRSSIWMNTLTSI